MHIIEIKTGKSESWWPLQLAGYQILLESPAPVEYARDGHIYTAGDGRILPSVTGILTAEGIIDTSHYTEEGRRRGSLVHLAIHLYDTAQIAEEEIDAETEPYLRAWLALKRDTGFMIESSEKPLSSALYGFAGTPDKVGFFGHSNLSTRIAAELHKDGSYNIFSYNDPADYQLFLSILAVHNYKRRRK